MVSLVERTTKYKEISLIIKYLRNSETCVGEEHVRSGRYTPRATAITCGPQTYWRKANFLDYGQIYTES